MRIRKLNHSVYQVQYHIVWGTKYRRKILKAYVVKELIKSLYKTQKAYPAMYFHTINTNEDHAHLQMEIPLNLLQSGMIQKMKAYSATHLKKHFKFLRDFDAIWSVGYFISTIGLNEEMMKYIESQREEDLGTTLSFGFE